MTIYVDTPRWEWQGHRWAHLISDTDVEELHRFAREVGLRYLSFGLDHYDIADFAFDRAVELGAVAVPSRELARRLVESGMRRRVGHGARRWRLAAAGVAPVDAATLARAGVLGEDALGAVHRAVDAGLAAAAGGEWRFLWRPGEAVAMLQWDPTVLDGPDHADVAAAVGAATGGAVERVVTARDVRGASVEVVVAH